MLEDESTFQQPRREEYELVDHTADVGVRVYGKTLTQLFSRAATAMTAIMLANPEKVQSRQIRLVRVEGTDLADLLVRWLNELLYLAEIEHFLGSEFTLTHLEDVELSAEVKGEPFDPTRHQIGVGIKAATYHDLEVVRKNGEWVAQVVFDT